MAKKAKPNVSPAKTAATTSADDFHDPAFQPPPPFVSTDEVPEETADDTCPQAKVPATDH